MWWTNWWPRLSNGKWLNKEKVIRRKGERKRIRIVSGAPVTFSISFPNAFQVVGNITVLQNFNQVNQGYDDHLNEVPNEAYRHLDAPSLRVLRIIMHSCLFWSRVMNIDEQYTR